MKNYKFKSACVIGLGYVGLPTAAILASYGLDILGVDQDPITVDLINNGKTRIIEPDLEQLVQGVLEKGNFRADIKPGPANAFIIAVPTPFSEGFKPDLHHVKEAIESLSEYLTKGDLIVIESTCPVGTTNQVCHWLSDLRKDLKFPHIYGADADINISHSPERVLPGNILSELKNNDRVIGGVSRECAERTEALYKIVIKGNCLLTNARTAELVKLAENAFRDVNIAFANELALICEKLNIDPWEAIELANRHPRVNILNPGPGVGGHCIAVDPWFLVHSAPHLTPLIKSARKINDGKPLKIAKKILSAAKSFKKPVIACFGLAYKNDIADIRESPAIKIVNELAISKEIEILIVEPYLHTLPKPLLGLKKLKLVNENEALKRAQLVALLTDHNAFESIDKTKLASKLIFDTRGLWR